MKNKRNRLILTLLLLIAVLLFFWWKNKEVTEKLPAFTLQGNTDIGAGDIEMKVWDNNAEDGDTVTVYFNGKKILDTLPLLYEKKILQLGKLEKGEYLLGVSAINEGNVSPASCSISLSNGKEEKEFVMDCWIDSAASWKITIR